MLAAGDELPRKTGTKENVQTPQYKNYFITSRRKLIGKERKVTPSAYYGDELNDKNPTVMLR